MRSQPEDAPAALRRRLDALAVAQAELDRIRSDQLAQSAQHLADRAHSVDGGHLLAERVPDVTGDELRSLAKDCLTEILHRGSGRVAVVLATDHHSKAHLVAAISSALLDDHFEARHLLARAAKALGGGAGGKGAIASAGGRHADRLDEALATARHDAETHLRRH